MCSRLKLLCICLLTVWSMITYAGPFPPAAGTPGSTAIIATSSEFSSWASGFTDLVYGTDVSSEFQTPERALGPASISEPVFDIVSLGNGGTITLSFDGSISNGPGFDFAVFENSFDDIFLELAYVEVSSDGTNFTRFENFSLTANPVPAFGQVDTTNIIGYAGKYRGGYGTPFDLNELAGTPGLDVNAVRYVRIVDIRGNGTDFDDMPMEFGGPNPIYDPFPTMISGGFDLEAVGVIHFIPDSTPIPIPLPALVILAWVVIMMTQHKQKEPLIQSHQ